MKRLMTAEDEVERVAQSSADELRVLADRLVRAKATGNGPLYERTMADVAELYGDLLAWSDLLGRRRMFMLAERAEVAERLRQRERRRDRRRVRGQTWPVLLRLWLLVEPQTRRAGDSVPPWPSRVRRRVHQLRP